MKNVLFFLAQLFIIWAIYILSKYMAAILHLPIPGSVVGMIILFLLLFKGIIKVQYIERAASFLNKYLAFFFVPFAVGLMNYGGLVKSSGLQILLMIAGSSIVGLLMTGGLTQYLSRKGGAKHEQSKREQSNYH